MLVLIPAYEPGDSLISLIRELRSQPSVPDVLVVDDGSGPDFDEIFALARIHGATVHRYPVNRGKGHALKPGSPSRGDTTWVRRSSAPTRMGSTKYPTSCVWLMRWMLNPARWCWGGRRFTGQVPLRSAVGNKVTSWLFKTLTAIRVGDTQTGLRGYPPSLLEWLGTIPGERFEYELSLLLQARQAGIGSPGDRRLRLSICTATRALTSARSRTRGGFTVPCWPLPDRRWRASPSTSWPCWS